MEHPLPVIAEAVRAHVGFVGDGIGIWRGVRGRFRDWRRGRSPTTWRNRLARWDRPTDNLAGLDGDALAALVRRTVAAHVSHGGALDPVVAGYFERILAHGRDAGLQVVVVEAPVIEAHLDQIAAHIDVAEHDRFVARSVARLGADFLDLRHALPDLRCFSDPEHVSLEGRWEVTRLVREHLAASGRAGSTGSAPPTGD